MTYTLEYTDGYYIALNGEGVLSLVDSADREFGWFVVNALNKAKNKNPKKKSPKRSGGGLLITPADEWFSKCVRERAEWRCERCGTQYSPPTRSLQCSHYKGRGKWGVRFEPQNALCLCYGCHQIVGSDSEEHDRLHAKIFGSFAKEIVNEKARNYDIEKRYKLSKGVGEIASHYKAEYERLMSIRAQGVTGRLEFTGWL